MAVRTGCRSEPGKEHTIPDAASNLQDDRAYTPAAAACKTPSMDMNPRTANPATIDLNAIKARYHSAWSSGDYAVVGNTLQIVGETLCEAVDLRSNQRVLDVAAGNGNATLAAARRFAEVVSTDYVDSLLEHGAKRAEADRLTVTFQQADAESLPFPAESFDVVLSTFGVMFTPNQEQAARELLRVCRRGGKIGLANWTPGGFIGRLFKTIGQYVPPAPGVKSPLLWGTKAHLDALFGSDAAVAAKSTHFVFRYKSPRHWVEFFRAHYGPVLKAFAAIEPDARAALEADIYALLGELNTAQDGSLVVPGEYLEVVITRNR